MNITKIKYIVIFIITVAICLICTNVKAAGIGLNINKSTATVGDTFSATISGINGKVSINGNSNITISPSGTQWVEGTLTITGTAKSAGTGTITVTPVDASTTGANPEEVTASASKSITINEKEEPKVEAPTNPEPTTPTPATTETKKSEPEPTTTTKTNTSTKKTETKTETKKEKKEEEKPKEDNFYINSIIIKGLKETGEQVDIPLSPEFEKNVFEYTCNIPSDIQSISIQKDAGEYTNSVIETGLEELKEGENTITLQLLAEDHQAKTYTINAIKEKKEQIEEPNEVEAAETTGVLETLEEQKQEENKEESKNISMPVITFILMQIAIISIEVLLIKCVPWSKIFKFSKH